MIRSKQSSNHKVHPHGLPLNLMSNPMNPDQYNFLGPRSPLHSTVHSTVSISIYWYLIPLETSEVAKYISKKTCEFDIDMLRRQIVMTNWGVHRSHKRRRQSHLYGRAPPETNLGEALGLFASKVQDIMLRLPDSGRLEMGMSYAALISLQQQIISNTGSWKSPHVPLPPPGSNQLACCARARRPSWIVHLPLRPPQWSRPDPPRCCTIRHLV